jgi:predicted CxxxxCH...CXXCH cytochrome family protein
MAFVAPNKHVDGTVQVKDPGCTACHGSGDDPAPPPDTEGNQSVSSLGVGAHAAHLAGTDSSRALACEECHQVAANEDALTHPEGSPAVVMLTGVAESGGRSPVWARDTGTCANSWCHGPGPGGARTSPEGTSGRDLDCQSCHGTPPPLPHPQSERCSACHGEVIDESYSIVAPERHVDGTVDLRVEENCTHCHGDLTAAPPHDTGGGSSTSRPGVGAHQAHLADNEAFRPLVCGECHSVPERVLDPGHLDSSLPAEVVFSGVALTFGAEPSYDDGSCSNTYCHGAVFPDGDDSGGLFTEPARTRVDGSQTACGGCHALPPLERPHPNIAACSNCHKTMNSDNMSFRRPDLHVDGKVDFAVP